jgi:hypothetical protein
MDGGVQLTVDGREVCLHPELLDEYLGPRCVFALVDQSTTVTAQQTHGSVVGGKNVVDNINHTQTLNSR